MIFRFIFELVYSFKSLELVNKEIYINAIHINLHEIHFADVNVIFILS